MLKNWILKVVKKVYFGLKIRLFLELDTYKNSLIKVEFGTN